MLNDRAEADSHDAVDAIRIGIAAVAAGRVKPAREALAELQQKLGISAAQAEA
jgi:uncharacterized protein YlxP (DUF503 family)